MTQQKPPAKTVLICLKHLFHQGKDYLPGATVELEDATLVDLLIRNGTCRQRDEKNAGTTGKLPG